MVKEFNNFYTNISPNSKTCYCQQILVPHIDIRDDYVCRHCCRYILSVDKQLMYQCLTMIVFIKK